MKQRLAASAAAVGAVVAAWAALDRPPVPVSAEPVAPEEAGRSWLDYRRGGQPVVGLADADVLREQYATWRSTVADPYEVVLFPTGLVERPERAGGRFSLDAEEGVVRAEVRGLVPDAYELWLVDNVAAPGASVLPDPDDRMLRVGAVAWTDGVGRLERAVDELVAEDALEIDQVVLTPPGWDPTRGGVLFGSPSLFQRLHALEERMDREARRKERLLLGLAVVAPQSGGVPTGFPDVFDDLVTEGEDLFFNETFDGNGRTCGTCHFAVDNFTIDVDRIASLPPDDPLFVAEFQKPLIFGHPANLGPDGRPRRMENPALMRAFALIVENLDGFGDLESRFTMRGVPHNIGMRVSVQRPEGSIAFPDGPDERTGWSGDGSPFGVFACNDIDTFPKVGDPGTTSGILVRGTTRSFALGAVIQHFPLTLDRDFCPPDPDFRLPDEHELDAFEAFLFALGRQTELNLDAGTTGELILADDRAEKGKVFFRDPEATGNLITCNNCHENAGANVGKENRNFDTNVEEFLQNRIYDPEFTVVGEPRPIDGGFGHNPDGNFEALVPGPGNGNENFGDGTFNTVSLVEAADTAPFFHANVAFTLEESIDFYASEEFAQNFPAIRFTEEQRDAVAAFLRAVNALDNIEGLAVPRAKKAIDAIQVSHPNDEDVISFLLEVAIADTGDAIEVLRQSGLHDTGGLPVNAVRQLRQAQRLFMLARNPRPPDAVRIGHVERGLEHLAAAVDIVRVSP